MTWLSSIEANLRDILIPSVSRSPKIIPAEIYESLSCDKEVWFKTLKKRKIHLEWKRSFTNRVEAEYDFEDNRIYMTAMVASPDYDPRDDLIQTYLHELIHVNQFNVDEDRYYYKKIGGRNEDEYEDYLSYIGEIEAYGHCLFVEFQDCDLELCETFQLYEKTDLRVSDRLVNQAKKWERLYRKAGIKINNSILSY